MEMGLEDRLVTDCLRSIYRKMSSGNGPSTGHKALSAIYNTIPES